MSNDPHRPQYHFMPEANWMNDPNGLIHWRDEYHMFYQYNPTAPCHGNIHWGHAVSKDLVHWEHLPIAIAPTPDSSDKDGCYSGCAIDNNGVPTLVYTAVLPQVQSLVTCSDDMRSFTKHPANPVLAAPPDGMGLTGFRDPYVWREDDTWYMAIGSGGKPTGGVILLYRSADLVNWEYLNPLYGDKENAPEGWDSPEWECPSFFKLGDKYVLIVSMFPKVLYWIGEYKDYKFVPDDGFPQRLDLGPECYAPQVFIDSQDRRLMFAWAWEARSQELANEAGWNGVQTLPRVLEMDKDGKLVVTPAPEVTALRRDHQSYANIELDSTDHYVLEGVTGESLEIIAEFGLGTAQQFGLNLRCSPDLEEQTKVVYDCDSGQLLFNRSQSCSGVDLGIDMFKREPVSVQGGAVNIGDDGILTMRVFVDRSIVEVYANGQTLTGRAYPSRDDSVQVGLFAKGGTVRVKTIDLWKIDSIW